MGSGRRVAGDAGTGGIAAAPLDRNGTITVLKHATAALLLTAAIAAPAFAQGDSADRQNLGKNSITFTTSDSQIVRKTLPENVVADLIAQGAQPMAAGVMMIMHNGKMYTLTDKKMADGKMASHMVVDR